MEKKYSINVDCANCAAKMERKIEKIKGVENVAINFMSQKMFIEAGENEFERIMEEVLGICKKIDKEIIIEEI